MTARHTALVVYAITPLVNLCHRTQGESRGKLHQQIIWYPIPFHSKSCRLI